MYRRKQTHSCLCARQWCRHSRNIVYKHVQFQYVKKTFSGSKYPKMCYLIVKTEALVLGLPVLGKRKSGTSRQALGTSHSTATAANDKASHLNGHTSVTNSSTSLFQAPISRGSHSALATTNSSELAATNAALREKQLEYATSEASRGIRTARTALPAFECRSALIAALQRGQVCSR